MNIKDKLLKNKIDAFLEKFSTEMLTFASTITALEGFDRKYSQYLLMNFATVLLKSFAETIRSDQNEFEKFVYSIEKTLRDKL